MKRTQLAICEGKHCRKVALSEKALARTLGDLPVDVRTVRCQKICRPPVLGVRRGGQWHWFARMDSRKALESLREFVTGERLSKPLMNRLSAKRAGKLRR